MSEFPYVRRDGVAQRRDEAQAPVAEHHSEAVQRHAVLHAADVRSLQVQRGATCANTSRGSAVDRFFPSLRVIFFLFSLAFLTSSGVQVQGEGDGRQADGLASVAARPVPVQHVQVSVGGAHQQVLLEGLQTGGGEGRRSRDAENERKVKGERLRRQQQNQITNGNSVGQQWDESWSSCAAPASRETEAEAEASCDDITPRPGLSQRAAQCS